MSIFKQLTDKSWATQGVIGAINDRSLGPAPAAKTGLAFFLAVLSSMFGLFVIGYRLRMAEPDWVPIADPGLLWFNTALLILSSVFMERTRHAAAKGKITAVRNNLTLGGLLAIGFLLGQYMAWDQLHAAGYYAALDAAAAFFYLLTALHGLHLLGGLLVWGRAAFKSWQHVEVARIKLSIELCTTYWHYLLLVWFVFFTLLLST
jgi:cytochrome c oxidase subunit 3